MPCQEFCVLYLSLYLPAIKLFLSSINLFCLQSPALGSSPCLLHSQPLTGSGLHEKAGPLQCKTIQKAIFLFCFSVVLFFNSVWQLLQLEFSECTVVPNIDVLYKFSIVSSCLCIYYLIIFCVISVTIILYHIILYVIYYSIICIVCPS